MPINAWINCLQFTEESEESGTGLVNLGFTRANTFSSGSLWFRENS
jgi:hypothetical protein